jgi:hypothetical protein
MATTSKKRAEDTVRLMETVTSNENMEPITRFEQLAKLIWDHALGYIEIDVKKGTEIRHTPDKPFIHMIYDRMEGKIPNATDDTSGSKASLADKIRDQSKSRVNSLSE